MARINLIPWRAARRKQREREFFMQLGAAFVAALLVLFAWGSWMGLRVDNQNDRNAYLKSEIKQVDVRIAKIKDLDKVRKRLLARKDIIEQLQANRAQMVHLFDELVKTIPASARLTGLNQRGSSMKLRGVAQSNASVAEYMRHIEASPWMGHAALGKTQNTHNGSRMPYSFNLVVKLNHPAADDTSSADPVAVAAPTSIAPTAGPVAPGTQLAGDVHVSGTPVQTPATPVGQPAAAAGPAAAGKPAPSTATNGRGRK